MNRRKLSSLIALVLAIGLFTAASAPGSAAGTLIEDKFNEKTPTPLQLHAPNAHPAGSSWDVKLGTWVVKKGALELSDAPVSPSSDYRAVIDSGSADVSVVVEVKVGEVTDQFWGVVGRYTGELDWIMAWHDGVNDVVLGKKVSDEDQWGNQDGEGSWVDKPTNPVPGDVWSTLGGFQELGRVAVEMGPQKKAHKIELVVIGSSLEVFADGVSVISRDDEEDHLSSGVVGIFSRGTGDNLFYKFKVTQDGSGGGPVSSPLPDPDPDPEPEDVDKGKKDKKPKKPKKGKK